MSIVGLVGAAIAIAKPQVAAVLMAVAAVLMVILDVLDIAVIPWIFLPGAGLLLIAAILAFLGRKS